MFVQDCTACSAPGTQGKYGLGKHTAENRTCTQKDDFIICTVIDTHIVYMPTTEQSQSARRQPASQDCQSSKQKRYKASTQASCQDACHVRTTVVDSATVMHGVGKMVLPPSCHTSQSHHQLGREPLVSSPMASIHTAPLCDKQQLFVAGKM